MNLKIESLLKISPYPVSERASQMLLILKNNNPFHNHEPKSHSFTIHGSQNWILAKIPQPFKLYIYIYIYKREHINIAIPFYDFKKSTQSQMLQINNIPIISLITNQQLNPKSNLYLESQPLSIKRSIQILHILMMNHPNSQPVTKITLNQHSMILKIEFNAKSQPAK
jgi:hypothetical protein